MAKLAIRFNNGDITICDSITFQVGGKICVWMGGQIDHVIDTWDVARITPIG